ncbi:D-alanyl-D-alanine carboxypeptidase family protein [Exiguobacterium qingdaonense]|uniref:D-alanyl-D-alanine carboxypeptidase family protein n=1 Tax=Exiguobacterium qingdaonense TaxID=2751251 RepID=UPI001F0AD730|nr:serine hydrolase [Exiguobacterium qingdaonense]
MTRTKRHRRRTYIMRRMIAVVALLGIIILISTLVGFKQEKEPTTRVIATPTAEPMKQGPTFPEIEIGTWSPNDEMILQDDEISVGALTFVDVSNEQVLIDKNANSRVFPASTTKLMTSLLAYEKAIAENELDMPVVTIEDSTLDIPWDSHIAHLAVGDRLTVRQALYATLLESGNDAANSLAEYTSGTIEAFVQLMNDRAKAIGLTETHFMNAHGYSDPNHYTTANDMAKIAYVFSTYPELVEIAGTYEFKAEFKDLDGNEKRRWWYHLGSSVNERSIHYSQYVTATKTGYTDESGYTMVFIMQHEGDTYILVTMQAKSGQTFPTMRLVEEIMFQ